MLIVILAVLFQNAKIQDLNVIHNETEASIEELQVVSECKDTRFECNSQRLDLKAFEKIVVSECKDTRFECNSQQVSFSLFFLQVVSECKDTRFECNSQPLPRYNMRPTLNKQLQN